MGERPASGLIQPKYPLAAMSTYGKTFHTWQYDRDDFPYGIPQLMLRLTGDGQADEDLIAERDRRLGLSTAGRRAARGHPDAGGRPGREFLGERAHRADPPGGAGLQEIVPEWFRNRPYPAKDTTA